MVALKKGGETIIPTPTWVLVVRICQIVISIISLGLSAWWIHGLYANPVGFAIVCVIFTWVIVAYALVSERVPAARRLYNTWAVLALDALMIIFWLAAMGALAAYRGRFTVSVQVTDCYNDGSAVGSNHCTIVRKRAVGVATQGALSGLSGNAGLCAIELLLFVATFAYVAHFFRLAHAADKANDPEKSTGAAAGGAAAAAAAAGGSGAPGADPAQSNPLLGQQPYPGQPQQHEMYAHPQPQGYPQQQVPQEAPTQYSQNQPYDPYVQQNTAYAGGAGGAYPPADQTQQQYQQYPQQPTYPTPQGTPAPIYSPQGTPAPGQPYQLPAQ